MAVNLIDNVCRALYSFPVSSLVCWIRRLGEYKLFVANCVNKIREHLRVTWRHVPSKKNPIDVASRGGLIDKENQLW